MDDELVFDVNYISVAHKIVDGLSNKFDNVRTNIIVSEKTRKDWVKPRGNYLLPNFDNNYPYEPMFEDITDKPSLFDFKEIGRDCKITLDNGVQIKMRLQNNYDGMELSFTTYWYCETVQRKEAIEEHMVNFPLEILGKVQSVVERVLKTKKFGYDVENVEIDCNFKAITLNESKCTPDIVKMTREARKQWS